MKYEIINPSDKCYITSDEPFAAMISCMLIGCGWYGLKDEEGTVVLPPFVPVEKMLNISGDELKGKVENNRIKIYECLRSFEYDSTPTSCNNIGSAAKYHADMLEKLLREEGSL